MNIITIVMMVFAMIGAVDRMIGNRLGLGKEFEKGFMLLGNMALSMIGMIVLAPFIAEALGPLFDIAANVLHIDPSVIPASLFANDMGGATLAVEVAANPEVGQFNAMVVSATLGCTVSFIIPYALGVVKQELHRELLFGLLCGIVTIPFGSLAAGLVAEVPLVPLLVNLLPLALFSGLVACGLVFCPQLCLKIFGAVGVILKVVITIGLALGVLRFITGVELVKGLAPFEEGAAVCISASAMMAGAFPLMHVVSRVLAKPLKKLGEKVGISETSAMGFAASLATCMTTFEMVNRMDKKGVVLNSAFAVSAASVFAAHLAFTMAFDPTYIVPVIVGKLVSGFLGLFLAAPLYRRLMKDG